MYIYIYTHHPFWKLTYITWHGASFKPVTHLSLNPTEPHRTHQPWSNSSGLTTQPWAQWNYAPHKSIQMLFIFPCSHGTIWEIQMWSNDIKCACSLVVYIHAVHTVYWQIISIPKLVWRKQTRKPPSLENQWKNHGFQWRFPGKLKHL